jgi:hypothetical protein
MNRAESPRRIMIAGGSGLIGRHLAGELLGEETRQAITSLQDKGTVK